MGINIFKEPITRRILLLVGIVAVGFIAVIVVDESLHGLSGNIEATLANQRARRILGRTILNKLLETEHILHTLALTDDVRDVGVARDNMAALAKNMQTVLGVLRNGGEYENIVPANFGCVDKIKERISFRVDPNRGYVIEVIDLTPKVLDIMRISAELVRVTKDRLNASDERTKNDCRKNTSLLLKQGDELLLRSRESANKIFHESYLTVKRLGRDKERWAGICMLIRYAVIGFVAAVGGLVCLFSLRRIGTVLREREQTQLELAEHRDNLGRLVAERTAELAAANEDLRSQMEQRKQSEHDLRESETRHRTLYEFSTDAIMLATPESGFFACNPAAVKLFGCVDEKELTSTSPAAASPARQPDGRPSGEKALEMMATAMEKGSHSFEWKHKRSDGQEFDATVLLTRMELNGRQVLQATVRDITEQRNLQAQLVQAQKLESLGQLSAGIAHEINTPTQYVGDNIRFLEDGFREIMAALREHGRLIEAVKEQSVTEGLLREIGEAFEAVDLDYLRKEIPAAISQSLEGVERVSEIVRAMKQFSHPGGEEKTPADINGAISSTVTVARNEWKYVAEMETDFDENLPPVPVLLGDFNQVILNIIVNAAQAIGERNGDGEKGMISISTRPNGDWAEVRIRDTGGGIPDEIADRIFDPFFTTKEVGKGTGQGLAISHSVIVEKHGGTIDFETEPGVGTTFILRLPLDAGNAQGDPAQQPVECANDG